MNASLTFQEGDLKILLVNERNQVSARFKETMSIELTGHPVYCFLLKDLDMSYASLTDGRSIPFVIKKAVKALPEELREMIFQSEDYQKLVGRIRTAARDRTLGFEEYFNKLSFKYERDSNVKIENNKIRYRLFTSDDDKTKISVSFIKEANRKYYIALSFIYKAKGIKKALAGSFLRHTDPVSSVDILTKQIERWLDKFVAIHQLPEGEFDKTKASVLSTVAHSQEVLTEILERFNNGWEI